LVGAPESLGTSRNFMPALSAPEHTRVGTRSGQLGDTLGPIAAKPCALWGDSVRLRRQLPAGPYEGAHVRLTKFKTKQFFTLGIYFFVWRHQVATWLRDDFQAPLDPAHEVISMFIPIYGLVVLWGFLKTVKATQLQVGMGQTLSPGRAFWWSSLWFNAGPYINGQLNALDSFAKGKAAAPGAVPSSQLG
jgi:hypothetical protein